MSRRHRAATSRHASVHHTEAHEAGDASTDSEDADLERVAKGLKRYGLAVRDVRRDGNCFFRAVSDQMYGTEDHHAYLRDLCCDYMEKHEEELAPFLDDSEDYAAYVDHMREDGVWAGNIEIHATSMATHRDVRIHQHKKPSYDLVNHYRDAPLHLFYHYGEHYASVRPIDQIQDQSPAYHGALRSRPSAGSSSTSSDNDPRETWAVLEDSSTELLQKVEHAEAAARYFRRMDAHEWAERLDEEAAIASDTLTHVQERVGRWKVAHAEKRDLSSDEDGSESSTSGTNDSYGSTNNARREKKYLTRTLARADERISDILESAARVRDSQQGEKKKSRSKKRDQEERRKARKARRRREQELQARHRNADPPLSIGMWSVS